MEEQLISFETAKLAKEKGFNVSTYAGFGIKGGKANGRLSYYPSNNLVYSRPTQALLQKWLREKHQIFLQIETDTTSIPKFSYKINQFFGDLSDLSKGNWGWGYTITSKYLYDIYDESFEMGLQEGLNLI